MTRLNDLHLAARSGTEVRWDPRSVDVLTAVQTARRMRAQFTADLLRRGFSAFGRLSGVSALFSALARSQRKRRTLHELSLLSDRALADIGLQRDQIAATATEATAQTEAHRSVWHMIADRIKREYRRRKTVAQLSAMSDRVLQDIGIERADIGKIAAALADGKAAGRQADETAPAQAEDIRIPEAMVLLAVNPGAFGQKAGGQPHPANMNHGHPSAA